LRERHLDGAIAADFDVRGFQIAVDNPLLVRGFERLWEFNELSNAE